MEVPASPVARGDRQSVEDRIAALWKEILELDEVSPSDTFFDLGGESIAATLCAGRIKRLYGVTIPVSLLLDEATTATSLAAHVLGSMDGSA